MSVSNTEYEITVTILILDFLIFWKTLVFFPLISSYIICSTFDIKIKCTCKLISVRWHWNLRSRCSVPKFLRRWI